MANQTTNYSIDRPTLGGDQDQWGSILNDAIQTIDTTIKTVSDAVPATVFQSSITDTPNSLGSAKQVLRVNSAGNNTEFATPAIVDLSDTPSSMGSAGQILKVNSGGTALEWGTDASGGGGGLTYSDFSASTASTPDPSYPNGLLFFNNSGEYVYSPPDLSVYQTTASAPKVFTSGWQNFGTYGTSNITPLTHGLGGEPDIVQMQFKCTTADLNYAVGDIVTKQDGLSDASDVFGFYYDNTTQIKVVEPLYQRVRIINRTSGSPALITTSSWQWRVKCVKI